MAAARSTRRLRSAESANSRSTALREVPRRVASASTSRRRSSGIETMTFAISLVYQGIRLSPAVRIRRHAVGPRSGRRSSSSTFAHAVIPRRCCRPIMAYVWHNVGMARTRVSTTVDEHLLASARQVLAPLTDAAVLDRALAALLDRHRATEIDAAYAAYDEHPLEEADEWGDLASFREAAAAS